MSSIENMWKRMLKDIHIKGHKHNKDDAEIKEILNVSGFIDSPVKFAFPGMIKGSLSRKEFLEGIRSGHYDIDGYNIKGEALADYVESINDKDKIYLDWESDESFIYTYPERLKAISVMTKYDLVCEENQIEYMIERLKENSGSNRAVATLYNIGLDKYQDDIPCLNWMQALIRDNDLCLAVMFRSNDIYNAFPSNMFFLMNVGLYIVEELQNEYPDLDFIGVYYNCTSAHYYTSVVTDEIIEAII